MEILDKVQEYIDEVKNLPKTSGFLTTKEASIFMNCSRKTVQRWAKIVNARLMRRKESYSYLEYDVKRMILRRKYNDVIRKFNKLYTAGYFEGAK